MATDEEIRTVLENMDLDEEREEKSGEVGEEKSKDCVTLKASNSGESVYIEPSNFKISEAKPQTAINKKDRQVSIVEPKPSTYRRTSSKRKPQNENPKARRGRSGYSHYIAGIHQFDPYTELTATQIAAFRQVFDIVDKDGGGGIDAHELYNSMKDLESGLKFEEISEILGELDRDGNGEIDFEEFLYMMTSMSLQMREAHTISDDEPFDSQKAMKRRQTAVFFSVMTKFAMKHSIKEIERYYASKARHIPHVVGHYAAGARVFGLSDKELQQTWKDLALASKALDSNSPYAQPLNFCIRMNGEGFKKKTIRAVKKNKNRASSVVPPANPVQASPSPDIPLTPTLRQNSSKKSPPKSPSGRRSNRSSRNNSPNSFRSESKAGWTPRHRLPITKVGLPYIKHDRKKNLTVYDMADIRDKVSKARDAYYERLFRENEEKAIRYWRSLKIDEIPSERLQQNFTRVFRAYSPTDVSEINDGSLSPTRRNKKDEWEAKVDIPTF